MPAVLKYANKIYTYNVTQAEIPADLNGHKEKVWKFHFLHRALTGLIAAAREISSGRKNYTIKYI